MGLNPEERDAVARMPDGVEGTVEVRVVTDGGSLRLWPEGDRIDPDQACDLVWDLTTMPREAL